MLIVLIHPEITHVPAPKAFMAIPTMVVMTLMNVRTVMSVVLAPYALIWRAVIAATVLQVTKAMDVQKQDALTLMNVHARRVVVMLSV